MDNFADEVRQNQVILNLSMGAIIVVEVCLKGVNVSEDTSKVRGGVEFLKIEREEKMFV